MGCGQSKHDDVAAGNTIARKRSSIRNSWRRNKDATAASESAQEQSQKNFSVNEGQADGQKSNEEGNVKEADVGAPGKAAEAEDKKEEDKKAEEAKTEDVVAGPENVNVEEFKEENAAAEVAPVAYTREKENTVPVIMKVEEKGEEAGRGVIEEKEAPVVKMEEIKEEAKAGNLTQEKENVATEITQSPVVVEDVKVSGKAAEEATGAEERVQAAEEKVPEKDVNEKHNVEVVEEKAAPAIAEVKVVEAKQEAESGL